MRRRGHMRPRSARRARTPPEAVPPRSDASRRRTRLPSTGVSGRRRTGRGALAAKSAPADERQRTRSAPRRRARANAHDVRTKVTEHARAPRERRAEFRGSTLRSHPFTSKRFHVLLNSLFKVLFNFPSRYLFAIGLVSVFSLRWSLPPALGCIHKQPDSQDAQSDATGGRTGLTPAMGQSPDQGDLDDRSTSQRLSYTPQFPLPSRAGDSVLGSSHFTRRYCGNPR